MSFFVYCEGKCIADFWANLHDYEQAIEFAKDYAMTHPHGWNRYQFAIYETTDLVVIDGYVLKKMDAVKIKTKSTAEVIDADQS
jgi:hypothetical protein